MTKNLWTSVITIIALVGIGFIIGTTITSKRTITVEVPGPTQTEYITQMDTVWVKVPVTMYVTSATIDTVYRDVEPAGFTVLASTTVNLEADDTRYGSVDIEYIYPPWDEFNTTFYPAPLPTVVKTVTAVQYRPQPLRYYQKPAFNWAVGMLMGGVIMKWASDHE